MSAIVSTRHERVVGGIALVLAFLMLAAITAAVIGVGTMIVRDAVAGGGARSHEIAACERQGGTAAFAPAGAHDRGVTVECHGARSG